MIPKLLAAAVLAFTVAAGGCTHHPYGDVTIDTTREAIVIANAELRAANLLLQTLIRSNSVSRDQAQAIKDELQNANTSLREALEAVEQVGDPLLGRDSVTKASRALDVALRLMAPLIQRMEVSGIDLPDPPPPDPRPIEPSYAIQLKEAA